MKRNLIFIFNFIFSTIIIAGVSCKKSNDVVVTPPATIDTSSADILDYKILGMDPQISITPLNVKIRFADSITNVKDLVASFILSPGAQATVTNVTQVSNVTSNTYETFLNYTVKSAGGTIRHWIVTAANNDYSVDWGLGYFVKQSRSNNRSYDWYFDQGNTGPYSSINCGPTSVTMGAKWADSLFTKVPQDARDYYPLNTSLWGGGGITEYLDHYGIPEKQVTLGNSAEETRDIIKGNLDSGRIVILALSMGAIRKVSVPGANVRVDKFYVGDFGHCIVAKGYKEVDDEFYFEVYDPYSLGVVYPDATPKGKDRYYRYEDVYIGCVNLGNYGIVVGKK